VNLPLLVYRAALTSVQALLHKLMTGEIRVADPDSPSPFPLPIRRVPMTTNKSAARLQFKRTAFEE